MEDPMIARFIERMMEDPQKYLALLRRQNALHCIWHGELQDRIAELETENARLRKELNGRRED